MYPRRLFAHRLELESPSPLVVYYGYVLDLSTIRISHTHTSCLSRVIVRPLLLLCLLYSQCFPYACLDVSRANATVIIFLSVDLALFRSDHFKSSFSNSNLNRSTHCRRPTARNLFTKAQGRAHLKYILLRPGGRQSDCLQRRRSDQ